MSKNDNFDYNNMVDICKKLLASRVSITAAQELVLTSLLNKLQGEIEKFNKAVNVNNLKKLANSKKKR